MTEFVQYEVVLTLRDNSTARGTISQVNEESITLNNALTSTDRKIQPSIRFLNSEVADLKVTQLPPFKSKSNESKKNKKTRAEDLVDDAIVYSSKPSRFGTPKPEKQKSKSKTRTDSSDLEPESIDNVKNKEFDFEANLAMFDKKAVFEDFKKNDHTSINDRLVGQNKVEKPATPKKQKYDNDEMVLQDVAKDNWDQIGKSLENTRTNTPNADTSKSQGQTQHRNQADAKTKSYKLVESGNGASIQSASPVQLLEIERLSSDHFGITPAVMAEVCATNLSKLIIDRCLGGSVRLSNKKNHNLPPLVLLLIGSGRCGSRAFATGRHLNNHGVRVLAFVISSDESDTELHHQWKIFESVGGKVVTSSFDLLIDIIRNQLNTPVELIIDALQGYDDHLDDVFYEPQDKKTLSSLISWCNSSEQSKVMSLDIPSGIDGGSGIPDDELKVDCSWCISMGLPLNGLLLAYKNGHLNDDITHYLIDVGIPNKVFQAKPNLRKFDNFWYTAESSIKLDVESI
ncbi:EDC3 [Candida theae]|uniref:Enhancer of mRNA-decapping protein 3 n=1 Tax=Candida theae TaxID=1198502 RepID=A0AAD5FYT1_9ASCO|nr:EDC3 [Candida theae]KAI5958553.1 EDC3 [Candida theae]